MFWKFHLKIWFLQEFPQTHDKAKSTHPIWIVANFVSQKCDSYSNAFRYQWTVLTCIEHLVFKSCFSNSKLKGFTVLATFSLEWEKLRL